MEQPIYKNILVIVVGFLVIDWIFEVDILLITAIIIGILSIFIKKFAFGLNWLWMKLALGLGWVNSRILLSVLYYLLLVPIAIMARIFKGNSIQLKVDKKSMYVERDHLYTKADLKDIW